MPNLIFKIATKVQWQEAEEKGEFVGAPIDIQDGYIHFSTAEQTRETAEKHFTGQPDLLLVAVDADKLGEKLVFERSRGDQLFPHLYDRLSLDAVTGVDEMPVGPDGKHVFPDGF